MLHRIKKESDPQRGKWNGIGGKLEAGESPEECVVREVFEESGLKIINPQLKGIITFPNDIGYAEDWYIFVYTATKFTGKLLHTNDVGDLEWIKDNELLKLKLNPADHIFLPWLNRKKIFSAKFKFHEERVADYSVKFY